MGMGRKGLETETRFFFLWLWLEVKMHSFVAEALHRLPLHIPSIVQCLVDPDVNFYTIT
jgi:hypothetical protein